MLQFWYPWASSLIPLLILNIDTMHSSIYWSIIGIDFFISISCLELTIVQSELFTPKLVDNHEKYAIKQSSNQATIPITSHKPPIGTKIIITANIHETFSLIFAFIILNGKTCRTSSVLHYELMMYNHWSAAWFKAISSHFRVALSKQDVDFKCQKINCLPVFNL